MVLHPFPVHEVPSSPFHLASACSPSSSHVELSLQWSRPGISQTDFLLLLLHAGHVSTVVLSRSQSYCCCLFLRLSLVFSLRARLFISPYLHLAQYMAHSDCLSSTWRMSECMTTVAFPQFVKPVFSVNSPRKKTLCAYTGVHIPSRNLLVSGPSGLIRMSCFV